MEFMLAKIYVKFYLFQINSSKSYFDYLKDLEEIDKLFNLEGEFEENAYEDNQIDVKYKKFFIFKEKVFSKVEVMGLVIETKSIGQDPKQYRYILYLDDGTSLIQCICWNNKNPNVYNNMKQNVKSGNFIIVYGYVDNYHGFEILVDNFKFISIAKEELNFHTCLKRSQEEIFNFKPFPMVIDDVATEEQSEGFYEKNKKEFANMLLAFFQNMLEVNDDSSNVFIKHSFDALFSDEGFNNLINKFCNGNGIKDNQKEQFLIDCLTLLEKQCLGSYLIIDGLNFMEININLRKIINQITSLFENKSEKDKILYFIDIYNNIHFNNDCFYNAQYIKFILNIMINKNILLFDSSNNSYSKIVY